MPRVDWHSLGIANHASLPLSPLPCRPFRREAEPAVRRPCRRPFVSRGARRLAGVGRRGLLLGVAGGLAGYAASAVAADMVVRLSLIHI